MNNTITNEEKVIRNGSLDILKFFSSYMVICIHFFFYGRVGNIIDALARFAVPVFFMTSGYFSYANNTEKLKKKNDTYYKNLFIWICSIFLFLRLL